MSLLKAPAARSVRYSLIVGLLFVAGNAYCDNVSAAKFAGDKRVLNSSAIEQAIKTIGNKQDTLVIESGKWVIDQSITVPANVAVKLEHGATFDIADSQTLAIEGSMETQSTARIFSGKGKVHFGDGYIKEVYPQWWGKIEGKDDTAVCQAALDSGAKTIRFLKATYAVDAVGDGRECGLGLWPASSTTLLFDHGAVLQAITTAKDDYTILHISNKQNVTVDGATIKGERNTHTGKGGEWGHGLRIVKGSRNIIVRNTQVSDCWGDGIYLGEGTVQDVYVENSKFDNNRRNGCSITNAKNVLFKNCSFSNSNATSPFKGVDCEPNNSKDVLQDITFEDCYSYKNTSGGFSVARDDAQDLPVSVTFRNCTSEEDGMGFGIDIGPSDCAGIMRILDCTVINPQENGFRATSANLQLKIDGLYIVNPNRKGEKRDMFSSGFVVLVYVPHASGKFKWVGNIDAKNIQVHSTDDKAAFALYTGNIIPDKSGLENLNIELKTNMPAEKRFFKGEGPYRGFCNVSFPDQPVVAATADLNDQAMSQYISQTVTNKGAGKNITLSLNHPRSVLLDSVYTIEIAEPHSVTLDLGGATLLPGDLKRLSSSQVGSRLQIKSDGKHWHIVQQTGAWK